MLLLGGEGENPNVIRASKQMVEEPEKEQELSLANFWMATQVYAQ